MITYQDLPRVFRLDDDAPLQFPAKVEISVLYGPPEVFGAHTTLPGPIRARACTMRFNGNTGSVEFKYAEPVEIIDVRITAPVNHVHFRGPELKFVVDQAESLDEVFHLLTWMVHFLPALLGGMLTGPCYFVRAWGTIGGRAFRWEIQDPVFVMTPVDMGEAEKKLLHAIGKQIHLFGQLKNRAVVAALIYVHRALRLRAAGSSPWEFFGECILNFHKALEVLFGRRRDEMRAGLAALGYDEKKIEGVFMPIAILRDVLDVGHPKLHTLQRPQAQRLFKLLPQVEHDFKDLCSRLLARLEEGETRWEVNEARTASRDAELDRVIASLEQAFQPKD